MRVTILERIDIEKRISREKGLSVLCVILLRLFIINFFWKWYEAISCFIYFWAQSYSITTPNIFSVMVRFMLDNSFHIIRNTSSLRNFPSVIMRCGRNMSGILACDMLGALSQLYVSVSGNFIFISEPKWQDSTTFSRCQPFMGRIFTIFHESNYRSTHIIYILNYSIFHNGRTNLLFDSNQS